MNRVTSSVGNMSDRRLPQPNGVVLVLVLIVLVMVSLAGFSFVASILTENKAVHLHGEELQIENIVASGEELLKAFLRQPPDSREQAGGVFDNPDLFRGVPVLRNHRPGMLGRFSIISPRIEEGEVTGVRFGLQDESSRLNLTVLQQWEKSHPGAARRALMGLPDMTESIADAILDWIDKDGQKRPFGAETDYYAGLDPPYLPRNRVPDSLEELLLVKGVTRELLFGTDPNWNHQPSTAGTENAANRPAVVPGGGSLPWAAMLTLHSAERLVCSRGIPRIYLNSSDLETLHEHLNQVFDEEWAEFIIAFRQFGPYRGSKPARSNADVEIDLEIPGRFTIASVLDLVDARVAMPIPGSKSTVVIASPFVNGSDAMREYLPRLLDHVKVERQQVIHGRINVNEAPPAVLRAVPGLSKSTVERIVTSRDSYRGSDAPQHRNPTWLLTENLVSLQTMKHLLPYLTARGDVFRAQVVGFFDGTGPSKRVEVVIDATSNPPRQVYWKDLRYLGIGYPIEMLGAVPSEGRLSDRPVRATERLGVLRQSSTDG